jgi:hypothetical protein
LPSEWPQGAVSPRFPKEQAGTHAARYTEPEPSPTAINNGTLTPSSRRRLCRHHRHLRCRRLPLRPLPRLALVEAVHRQLQSDQRGPSRGILAVFCSYPMVVLVALGSVATMGFVHRSSSDCDFRLEKLLDGQVLAGLLGGALGFGISKAGKDS